MYKHLLFFICLTSFIASPAYAAKWEATGKFGDWGHRDTTCSSGLEPTEDFCMSGGVKPGTVAVCWDNVNVNGQPDVPGRISPKGEDRCPTGTQQWCTYKNIPPSTPTDGAFPGKIYVCK